MTTNRPPRYQGKELWKEFTPKERRRIAAPARNREVLTDQREVEFALYLAARDRRQLAVCWVYLVVAGLSGLGLSAHSGRSAVASILYGVLFVVVVGAVILPLWIREVRIAKRTEAANRRPIPDDTQD